MELQAGEERAYPVYDQYYNAVFDFLQRQDLLYQLATLLTPVTGVQLISMALAGTGIETYRDFFIQSEASRRKMQEKINEGIREFSVRDEKVRMGGEGWPGALGKDSRRFLHTATVATILGALLACPYLARAVVLLRLRRRSDGEQAAKTGLAQQRRKSAASVSKAFAEAIMKSFELIRLEWGRLRRDRVFWLALALGCLALWYGLANGAAWMRLQQDAIARASVIAEEHIASAKAKATALAGAVLNCGPVSEFKCRNVLSWWISWRRLKFYLQSTKADFVFATISPDFD